GRNKQAAEFEELNSRKNEPTATIEEITITVRSEPKTLIANSQFFRPPCPTYMCAGSAHVLSAWDWGYVSGSTYQNLADLYVPCNA
ncbi:hypothetical protein SDJN02_02783, partial [Cucurbita argyrosperma subsp. argyrosperma]